MQILNIQIGLDWVSKKWPCRTLWQTGRSSVLCGHQSVDSSELDMVHFCLSNPIQSNLDVDNLHPIQSIIMWYLYGTRELCALATPMLTFNRDSCKFVTDNLKETTSNVLQ